MDRLIREIRAEADITQKQFAKELGTTQLSVNRWENGKTTPNAMAQGQIYEFCTTRGIDMFDFITDEICSHEFMHPGENVILYHGSRAGIQGDISPASRSECDFGKGFYMGTNPSQPLALVCEEDSPVIYTLSMDLSGLKVLHTKVDLAWAMLTAYNRGHMSKVKDRPVYKKYAHMTDGYDVVIGPIADDRMYRVLTQFFTTRLLTDVALINSLSALDLGIQYAALTDKACRRIRILSEKALEPLELSFIRARSALNRDRGIALADEVAVKYRREGRFFDEILEDECL